MSTGEFPIGLGPNVAGQATYWNVDIGNAASIPADEGIPLLGRDELLRPYRIDMGALVCLDESGDRRLISLPMDPEGTVTLHGIAREDQLGRTPPIVSFRYYKRQAKAGGGEPEVHREVDERVVLVDGVGWGVLLPGHQGERRTFYLIGRHAGNCAVGTSLNPGDVPNNVPQDKTRHFSVVRMGLLGDLNDPTMGEALRQTWGIDHIPEAGV